MTEMPNAPAGLNGGAQKVNTTNESSRTADNAVSAEHQLSELRARAAGYAVLVENPSGKYRRRLFLTLASAQRAKDRATARGQYAAILLVRIVPVVGGEFL